uniref:Uncharacterized protein n=1 Tax=Magallana gigas TaxID=29159 RepID=A0A8W8K0Y0_MAGGI
MQIIYGPLADEECLIVIYCYVLDSNVYPKSSKAEKRHKTSTYIKHDVKTDDRNKNFTHSESVETEVGNKTYTLPTSYFKDKTITTTNKEEDSLTKKCPLIPSGLVGKLNVDKTP